MLVIDPSGTVEEVYFDDGMKFTRRGDAYDRSLRHTDIARSKASHPYNYDPFTVWKRPGKHDPKRYAAEWSDHLLRRNFALHDQISQAIFGDTRQDDWSHRDPKKVELWLAEYFGHKVKLMRIVETCNQANGYSVWMFILEGEKRTPTPLRKKRWPFPMRPE